MLQIKTTGIEDYLDGSANIKTLVIGGPGVGKTRSASYWPAPIFLDCENSRGSLADRNMPYVDVRSSKDMLDALEFLRTREAVPKAQRQFQTVVVDTVDSFQRLVKDEWMALTKAATFSGFDAWGYLDTKMAMLLTRLLNLDYNVLVNVHYEDKIVGEGDDRKREYGLQLQGKVKDTIFNDFGLVGWLGTYWESVEGQKVQKRGLTFQPTVEKPFLKDRFNCTPAWLEITFTERDYGQLFEAFFDRPEFEGLAEGQVVGEIPDSDRNPTQPPLPGGEPAAAPAEGGPLPEVEVPLEKKLKPELEQIATELGVVFKGNTLKGELVALIKEAQAKPADAPERIETEPADAPERIEIQRCVQCDESFANQGLLDDHNVAVHSPMALTPAVDPTPTASENSSDGSTPTPSAAHASSALPEQSSPPATSGGPEGDEALPMGLDEVAAALGAEVIEDSSADAPSPQQDAPSTPVVKPSAPQGPSACADCGNDLGEEWSDPDQRQYIRLGFVRHRKYLCNGCLKAA